MKIAITWRGSTYSVTPSEVESGLLIAVANHHSLWPSSEQSVYLWLGDHGLPRRQARRLLDAAIRNEGPFADPGHPRRVV